MRTSAQTTTKRDFAVGAPNMCSLVTGIHPSKISNVFTCQSAASTRHVTLGKNTYPLVTYSLKMILKMQS